MNMRLKKLLLGASALAVVGTGMYLLLLAEQGLPDSAESTVPPDVTPEGGEQLARQYCVSCHRFPEPSLLDKETWAQQTLPHMGPQLGVFQYDGTTYPVERTPNLPENYYPSSPQISEDEWQQILDYYTAKAPNALGEGDRSPPIVTDTSYFRARMPRYRPQTPPRVTSIRFDPANELIYLSDASRSMFHIYDRDLALKDRYRLTSAISDIRVVNDPGDTGRRELLTTYIGDVNPSDALTGFVQMVWYDPQREQGGAGAVLRDRLARPVESQFTDLDLDGSDDMLINEFAHRTGGLFWLRNDGEGFESGKRTLIDTPGCIESHVLDYTGNGRPDVVALCSQLVQSIYLFENRGNGDFVARRLLQFPVTAGSSSFKLHDFNGDGHPDILYTSGDNADYSIIYKPYHGVYIYLNDGNDRFTEAWFYPVNGAYDAVADDFDRDGNTDIAAISFFADYEDRPKEGFLFFRGRGQLDFTPYHHPAAGAGRWIAMDVADWNGDGFDDIVLANFSQGPTQVVPEIQDRWMQGPHFLLLENRAGAD